MPINGMMTAEDIKSPQEWGEYFDKLGMSRMQNRLMRMQFDDLMKDRRVSSLLSQIPATQEAPTWDQTYVNKFDPATGLPIPGGAETGTRAGATPVSPEQWEAGQKPSAIPMENRLARVGAENPELSEQVNQRIIAEQKRKSDMLKASIEMIGKVHLMDPDAANQMFNNNPELVRMAGGPISISGVNQKEYKNSDGEVIAIAFRNPDGKWGQPMKVKEPTSDLDTYKAANPRRDGETKDAWNKRVWEGYHKAKLDEAKQKVSFSVSVREGAKEREEERKEKKGFKGWSPDEKENEFWSTIITGKNPKFSWGDRTSYTQFGKERNRFEIDHGITPAMKMRIQTDYKSLDRSTANQRKIYDMMVGFAGNLNQQIDKVKDIYSKLPRSQWRLTNLPIVELRRRAMGSGEEASAASYLIEISNEIGKLSTGSAASIRELSESAQERWNKIHDGTLPFKDMITVLDTTRDQADMRIKTAKSAMDATRSAIEDLSTVGARPVETPSTDKAPFNIDKGRIEEELKKRGVLK